MPTTDDGIEYFDDPEELLQEFRTWGSVSILKVDAGGPINIFRSHPAKFKCHATELAFERVLKFLTPCSDGKGWNVT